MAHRATPHTTTGYSPFYLLHGREMTLPDNDNLKPQLAKENSDLERRLENLKSNLRLAYEVVAESNKKSHQVNKQYYERKAKQRDFEVNDLVYLYSPTKKSGLTNKFFKPWHGPYLITKKLPALNYEITDQNGKMQVVHVKRLKRAYNSESWTPSQKRQPERKPRSKQKEETDESEEDEFSFRHFPQANAEHLADEPGHEPQTDHSPNPLPSVQQPMDTPTFI
jgi:hypothetical protein